MIVSDIKKYIEYGQQKVIDETNLIALQEKSLAFLDNIKSMLDELEPNTAKWRNICSGLECTRCKNIIEEWGEVVPEYCDCCGARMEVEDDTTPTIL